MKQTLYALFIILLSSFCTYSQSTPAFCGNLRTQVLADNTYTVTCIVELASLPFEGANEPTECLNTNRIGVFQNGTILREFEFSVGNCVRYDAFFPYHKSITPGTVTNPIDLASPFEPDHCNGAWSSAKYKITFLISPTGEKYSFYFNNLDIHFEKSNWYGRNVYGNDWTFQYNSALTLGSRVEIWGKNNNNVDTLYGTVSTSDTANGMPTREFKVWEMLYGRQQPFGRNFFARTTPFGISPQYIDSGFARNLILGTTVILDTVYNNSGVNDKYGYNTVDVNGGGGGGQFGYYYYFSNPPIDNSNNDTGNTYTTPAWFYFDENVQFHYGTKITAASGDTLWLKQRKVLWVTGILEQEPPFTNYKGDTIHFKSGSTLILEPSAELEACRGGVIIYETGSSVSWDEHTCNSAENSSQIVITGGGTFVVNNGGFIQIKDGGKLIIGDNTTLSFESNISPLILRSGSQVIMGNNSKIQFKKRCFHLGCR